MALSWRCVFLGLTALSFAVHSTAGQPLAFGERVKAQEALERVYYKHRLWPKENPGPKPTFEQMVPKAEIEAKVTESLKKCSALESFWQKPITGEQLQAELDRMVKGSKDPETLRELFAALNNDPNLIAECLARPILADRLVHRWYAADTRFHGDLKAEAQALRGHLTPANFPYLDAKHYHAVKIELEDLASPREGKAPDSETMRLESNEFKKVVAEYSEAGAISQVEETAEAFVIRWTESKTEKSLEGGVIVFEKAPFDAWFMKEVPNLSTEVSSTEGAYTLGQMNPANALADPPSPDSWKALWYVPSPLQYHTAVWTGTEMIVWGGVGGRYTPSTDSWTATSTGTNCPSARQYHTAVWTGTEMIVWGGSGAGGCFNTGGRYTPSSNSWTVTSTGTNCPSARQYHTAVWTGTEMIIWGGFNNPNTFNTGGRYAPSSDSWTATSTGTNCPSARYLHAAAWTGTEMVVWGGYNYGTSTYLNTGGRYTASSDSWTVTSTGTNCPPARNYHTAVWTGTEVIVWGGFGTGGVYLNTGGRYTPSTDSWMATSTGTNCPSARYSPTAVWTGTEMIVWGGYNGSTYFNTGGRYTPSSDSWAATSTGTNCPSARANHTVVWTGTEMIVWGGNNYPDTFNTGGRYTPSSDSWTATGTNCPPERKNHTAVWTGTEMIVWGGKSSSSAVTNTGGRYTPSTDSWTATSTGTNCPSARYLHTAVWTGTEMIVWGGGDWPYLNTGGRYTPSSNSWTATFTGTNCPSARNYHTAVWTGTEMIVWGGGSSNTGGRYTPSSNSWTATSTGTSCPSARQSHTAVWTGTEMIVWGGEGSPPRYKNDGGRYTPSSDSWTATSTGTNCPSGRNYHTSVWTGTEMIVWGGYDGTFIYPITGGRYIPAYDSWTATSTGTNCPSGRFRPTAVWTGTEMIVWGGEPYTNSGGRYIPPSDSWTATSTGTNCPSARANHTVVWTGTEMIVWDGSNNQTGGIFFPNTPPRSLPALSTSIGGDATFTLGTGETLSLSGSASTDGSNPATTTPYHDKLDSIVSYEWDLNGDANFGTLCASSASGVDFTGASPAALTEGDLASFGINAPGTYTLWLRVTDEVGVKSCGSIQLIIVPCAPTAPAAPSFTTITTMSLTVNWTAVSGATSYDVWRAAGAACTGAIKITASPVAGTTYDDTGLACNAQYSYFVVANNACGTSADGACASVTTSVCECWDTRFQVPGQGISSGVAALAWDGTNLYAGGVFTTAGGVSAKYVAKWDGSAWSALGTGMNGSYVLALAWGGANLYAGGLFTTAGGVTVNYIAKWDGTAWSPLGTGMNGAVSALYWDGSNLYAGGSFSTAGGVAANYIAKWDGTTWSALGTGMNAAVFSLASDGTNLYAGGEYTTAGGLAANNVAKWNGTAWSALGTGMNYRVWALAWDGTNLYAGGNFSTAGGTAASNIAKWNGTAWSALGAGMNDNVQAFAWDGTNLYAGGAFTTAVGVAANRIAKWNGTAWSALATGMNESVLALAWGGSSLYAGGWFTTAGGTPSSYIARWSTPPISSHPANSSICAGGSTSFAVAATGPGLTYQWQGNAGGGFSDLSNGLIYSGVTTPVLTLAGVTPGMNGYQYRCSVTGTCGAIATSNPATLSVPFCSSTEVSADGSSVPERLTPDGGSGFYIYFEKIPTAVGYNIYEGNIGSYYSHGSAAGNACAATVTDMGNGEMRASITPSAGDHYYLVTGFSGMEGPSGFDSSAVEIPTSQSTCAP